MKSRGEPPFCDFGTSINVSNKKFLKYEELLRNQYNFLKVLLGV